jgi:hypothetical protein
MSQKNIEMEIISASWPLRNKEVVEEITKTEILKWTGQLSRIQDQVAQQKDAFCGK